MPAVSYSWLSTLYQPLATLNVVNYNVWRVPRVVHCELLGGQPPACLPLCPATAQSGMQEPACVHGLGAVDPVCMAVFVRTLLQMRMSTAWLAAATAAALRCGLRSWPACLSPLGSF